MSQFEWIRGKVSVELPNAAWQRRQARDPSELPRLRSGFRLRAQTPTNRLNFDAASLLCASAESLGLAQEDRELCLRQTEKITDMLAIAADPAISASSLWPATSC